MTLNTTPYGNTKTAEQEIQFAVDPSFGLTRTRLQWYSNGTLFDSTNFTENTGDISLTTTATGTDTARVHTAYTGQYISHSQAQPGSSVTVEPANYSIDGNGLVSLSHGKVQQGAYWLSGGSVQTGILLEIRSDAAYARCVSGGNNTGNSPVAQENWNIDPCNGDGPSGFQLDPGEGVLANFIYTWYSKGNIYLAFVDEESDSLVLAHEFETNVTPSIATPNLPIQTRISNDGTATAMEVRQGGVQYTLNGADTGTVEERSTPITRSTPSGYISTQVVKTNEKIDPITEPGVPVLSVKRESGADDLRLREANVSVTPIEDVYLFFWDEWDDATALTNQSFSEPITDDTGKESHIVADVAATDYTPTTSNFRGMVKISGGKKNDVEPQELLKEDKVPIGATRVITAVHDGTEATFDPIKAEFNEGF